MKKEYAFLLLSMLLGGLVLLQIGCAWRGGGYTRNPYSYGSYYWYYYGGYYWYPYGSYYWRPYRSYPYRGYPYYYSPRGGYDDGHRLGPPRPPHSPPPDRRPYLLKPNRPKGEAGPPRNRPFLRKDQPKRR